MWKYLNLYPSEWWHIFNFEKINGLILWDFWLYQASVTNLVDNNQSPIIPGNQLLEAVFLVWINCKIALDLSVCLSMVAFVMVPEIFFFSFAIVRLNVVYKPWRRVMLFFFFFFLRNKNESLYDYITPSGGELVSRSAWWGPTQYCVRGPTSLSMLTNELLWAVGIKPRCCARNEG